MVIGKHRGINGLEQNPKIVKGTKGAASLRDCHREILQQVIKVLCQYSNLEFAQGDSFINYGNVTYFHDFGFSTVPISSNF